MRVSGWRTWLKRLSSSTKASRSGARRDRGRRPQAEELETRLAPATIKWTGLGTDARWSTSQNWENNVAPSPIGRDVNGVTVYDDLLFPGANVNQFTTANDFIGATFNSITIGGSNYQLVADAGPLVNKITLGTSTPGTGFIITNVGVTNDLIAFNIQLGGAAGQNQSFTVGSPGNTLQIDGQVTGMTGVTLTKGGPGTLILTADNSGFTGPITVTQGVIRITNALALGSGGPTDGITTVDQNAAIQVENVTGTIPETLLITGQGLSAQGALENTLGNNTWGGPIILDGNVTIGADAVNTTVSQLTISGQISDLGGGFDVTKEGSGKVIFARDNAYRGLTVVNAGILDIQDPLALGTGGLASNGTVVNASRNRSGTLQIENVDPTRTGFTIPDEVVTLNGDGFDSRPPFTIGDPHGALNNLAGDNTWAGNVALGTEAPLGSNVSIGVELGSSLAITGTVGDGTHPASPFTLTKTRSGRLIFTNNNTYNGQTIIANGALNVRDSNALGSPVNGTTVLSGAALELQVDGKIDSRTGTFNTLQFVGEPLTLNGPGANSPPSTGALRNVSGTNEWSGTITLASSAAIGVEPDDVATDPANPVFSQLTVTGVIKDNSAPSNVPPVTYGPTLSKQGLGELVLTNSNTYLGVTNINEGWITARNNNALGALITGRTPTLQPRTNVANGAALHLKQTVGGAPLTLVENITLNGNGIAHRNPWLNRQGALENLSGNNLITGDILLGGTAGIGVEVIPQATDPSELTLRGMTGEVTGGSGINKLGSKRLILQGDGTYTGLVDVVAGVLRIQNDTALGLPAGGTTVEPGTALEIYPALPQFQGGLASAGIQVGKEHLTLGGAGNTSVTGTLIDTLTVVSEDNYWRGNLTLTSDVNLDIQTNARFALAGGIDDGPSPTGVAGFTKTGAGQIVLAGAGTYRGVTLVNQGILNIQNGQALGSALGGTIVSDTATIETQGDVSIAGESLTVTGTGPNTQANVDTRWFERGPAPVVNGQIPGNLATSGRITGVTGDPQDANVLYLSAAGGGSWKSKDAGKTWLPLIDFVGAASTTFTGAIAVAPTDSNIIYVGTGETNNSGDSYYGRGVYKSTDAGKTWTVIQPPGNLFDRRTISKIAVDPFLPNVIYVAVSNNGAHGLKGNAGVWRYDPSLPAAFQWFNLTQYVTIARRAIVPPVGPGPDDDTATMSTFLNDDDWSDVVVRQSPNPLDTDTRIIFAALGNASGFNSRGFARNALYTGSYTRSIDLGQAPGDPVIWRLNGFPTGTETVTCPPGTPRAGFTFAGVARNGLIKVAVSAFRPFTPYTAYAPISYATTDPCPRQGVREIQKTTTSGTGWAVTTGAPPNYMGAQGWYNSAVAVDLINPNIVYVGGLGANFSPGPLVSVDGGATWVDIETGADGNGPHADAHAMGFDANGRLLFGADGGIWRLDNPNPSQIRWANLNGNLAITQIIGLDVHSTDPNVQYIGAQDNGTSKNANDPGWRQVQLGDGGYVRVDPSNSTTVYHTFYYGNYAFLERSDNSGGSWTGKVNGITTNIDNGSFYLPYVIDKINSNRLVLGTDRIYETTNRADLWQLISPVLSPIPGTNPVIGNPIAAVAVAGFQGQFVADPGFNGTVDLGPNTYDQDTIYATTTDGGVFVTKNHGRTWVNRSAGLPAGDYIDIQVDPRNRDHAYVVRDGFGGGKVFMTTTGGRAWADITGTLPDLPSWRVVVDPRYGTPDQPVLYLGNDNGVFKLTDFTTRTWTRFGAGLPNVQVHDMTFNTTNNTLSLGTYGRSVYDIWLDPAAANAGGLRSISGSAVWTGNITLTGNLTLGAEPGSSLTVVGSISDNSNNFGLTKIGLGKVILAGSNTYGGVTDVQEGVLATRNPKALGLATGNTIVEDGSALEVQNDILNEPLILEGNGVAQFGRNTGALRNVSGSNKFTGPITLATPTVTIGVDSGSELNITGTISQSTGQSDLVKEGSGRLILSGANSYSGQTLVNAGALNVQNALALGTTANGTQVMSGAQLQLQGNVLVVGESLILNGSGINSTGALLNVSGNNTWQGPITLATSPATIPPGPPVAIGANLGTLTIDGVISQSVPNAELDKVGPAKVILTQANNYAGATKVLAGTLNIRNPLALGSTSSGTVVSNAATLELEASPAFPNGFTVAGESLSLSGSGVGGVGALHNVSGSNTWNATITLAAASTIGVDAGSALTATNGSNGINAGLTADLTKIGAGTLFLPTANNNFLSTLIISQGVVNVSNAGALGGTTNGTTVASGATLQLQGNITVANETLRLAGLGFGNKGALENVSGNNTWQGNVVLTADSAIGVDVSTDKLTLNRPISESGAGRGVTKVGPGLLDYVGISGFSNTYTGITLVADGTLLLEKTGGSTPFLGDLVIGDGTGAAGSAVARWLFPDEVPDTSKVTVNSDGLLDLNNLSDAIGVLKIVDGTATTGAGNTGVLSVAGLDMTGGFLRTGTLGSRVRLNGDVTATSDATGAATILGNGGVLDLGSAPARTFTVNDGPAAIDLFVNTVVTGTGRLTKAGPGALDLTAANIYTGGSSVTNGTLFVDGSIGDVNVTGGTLGGLGTVGVITATGGVVAPGGVPGILRSGNATFGAGGTFNVDLDGLTPGNGGSHYDQLQATGNVNLGGASLTGQIGANFVSNVGDSFTILTATGTISGQFSQGDRVFFNGKKLTIAYNLRDVTITRVKADTTVSVAASVNPSVFGQPVSFTATVLAEPGANVAPDGTVTFVLDGVFTTVTLDANGKAVFTPSALTVTNGVPHSLSVIYNGGVDFNASNGNTLFQTVNKADTSPAIVASAEPSRFGQATNYTVTVSATAPGAGTPSGTVVFRVDGVDQLAPQTLNGAGQASISLDNLSVGLHQVNVSYSGDGNFNGFTATRYANYQHTVIKANSLVSQVVASSNPLTFGQLVTFTTSVTAQAPGAGTPTGLLTFLDGNTPLGTVTIDQFGNALLAVSTPLGGGTHVITAKYQGDGNFNAGDSSSTPFNFVVNPSGTLTSVASSLNTSTYGQSLTFTATVQTQPPGAGVALPTGTVQFAVDGVPAGNAVTLNASGQATFSISTLTAGLHNVTAAYSGDANFASSTGAFGQLVTKAGTTTSLTSSANPSSPNQPVTFTATLGVVAPGAGKPTGTISFSIDGVDRGAFPLDNQSQAIATFTFTSAGTHQVVASYNGDANFSNSSVTLPQGVNRAATATSVPTATPNPSVYGQGVTLTATVTGVGSTTGTPSGTLSFLEGTTVIGTATLDPAGRGRLVTTTLTAGTHAIVASYAGDTAFDVSVSATPVSVTVSKADTTISAITFGPNPATFGQPVSFAVTLAVVAPGANVPGGNVTFKEGNTVIGQAAVDATGTATLTSTTLTVGSHTIRASYDGDANFNPSAVTPAVTETINQAQSSVTLTSLASPSVFGQAAVVATVTAVAPATGVPTGTVTFTIDGTQTVGPLALDAAGKATIPGLALAVGTHTISATYNGDPNFGGTTTTTSLSQVVNKAPTATALSVVPATVVYSQNVVLTATVTVPVPGAGTPTGTVTFAVDGVAQGSAVSISGSGVASVTLSALAVGTRSITATYNGDGSFATSVSTASSETVNKADSATALRTSLTPSPIGSPVTLTATVTPRSPATATPGGQVNFLEGSTVLGSGTVGAGGVATLSFTFTGGTHTVTAVYVGDGNFNTSTSSSITQVVTKANTTTTVISSKAMAIVGRDVTFTITVASTNSLAVPGGSVTIVDGTTTLGTVVLVNGSAAFTTRFAAAGSHRIGVTYSGDSNFNGSSAASLTQQIGTLNQGFVAQVYLDILHRTVDAGGLNYWSSLLDTGRLSPAQFVSQLENSAEFRGTQVDTAYRTFLHRPADPAALGFWVPYLQSGHTIAELRAQLIGSDEYFARAGRTNDGFLDQLYVDVLNRHIDPAGRQLLLFLLQQFTPRQAIAANILAQSEAVDIVVRGLYQTYLRRNADEGGVLYFRNYLQHGGTEETIVAQLVGSQEYFDKL